MNAEITRELIELLGGEPVGIILQDPETNELALKKVNLDTPSGKTAGHLYLEWITGEGAMRTVEVD